MYYPCSENKDADQLRGYREVDLRLCFRPCKLLVFSRTGSVFINFHKILKHKLLVLIIGAGTSENWSSGFLTRFDIAACAATEDG